MAPGADDGVSRDTILAKLQEIKGEVETTATAAKPYGVLVGVAVGVVIVGLAYALGRRKGKKRTTLVEVRRV